MTSGNGRPTSYMYFCCVRYVKWQDLVPLIYCKTSGFFQWSQSSATGTSFTPIRFFLAGCHKRQLNQGWCGFVGFSFWGFLTYCVSSGTLNSTHSLTHSLKYSEPWLSSEWSEWRLAGYGNIISFALLVLRCKNLNVREIICVTIMLVRHFWCTTEYLAFLLPIIFCLFLLMQDVVWLIL